MRCTESGFGVLYFFSRQRKTFDLLNNFENYFRKKVAFPYTTPSFVLVFGPHWL